MTRKPQSFMGYQTHFAAPKPKDLLGKVEPTMTWCGMKVQQTPTEKLPLGKPFQVTCLNCIQLYYRSSGARL